MQRSSDLGSVLAWLEPLKVGRYKIAITAPGYQRVERTIEVQEDWTATVDVVLTKN